MKKKQGKDYIFEEWDTLTYRYTGKYYCSKKAGKKEYLYRHCQLDGFTDFIKGFILYNKRGC